MVGIIENSKFITKGDAGFPPQLNWENLRALGLDHIGKLSGKLWTDHNVHDPGITILEILCYALMDLGYRTNLPISDILARNPDVQGKDDNFFTPSEILTCNPVTITDFRKLLIDIPGVRNAWLDDMFYPCTDEANPSQDKKETVCSDCYNGLYRVYIETEISDTNPRNPEISEMVSTIKRKLMAHRNLCEDFVDIRVLCKKKVALCIDIELEKDADAEQVYQAAVNQLIEFFSPSPKFYTLTQLLIEKKKTIEEIYAGRPYNVKESHGFIDTAELEALRFRKEIHFSDVYQILLQVPGIRNINRLAWRKDGNPCLEKAGWTFNIPKDHVLEFSPEDSIFTFIRQGIPVSFDPRQFDELFRLSLSYSGKVSYKSPSPYLDVEMPVGVFRSDLGEYQSVQNDFPRVYGINTGGLSSSVSDRRRAQAYQLKGFLLFFDQLLANYLAQLQNLRPLFSFSSVTNKRDQRTYFINRPDDIPDIDKLLRFNESGEGISYGDSDLLARPVMRSEMEAFVLSGSETRSRCDSIGTTYYYREHCALEIAIKSWHQDLSSGEEAPVVFSTAPRCWMFYLVSSDAAVVLLGSRFYSSESEARQAADSTMYAAAHLQNFRGFENAGRYSFVLELRLSGYMAYLQGMVENESLYVERRSQFLDHLLSRFAERFTDFALLSFETSTAKELKEQEIQYKEKFLQQYASLSSNRGKAYDYRRDGWNNENLSGFEKRAMALAGMGVLKRRHLCNYVVEKFEEYYQIVIKRASGEILFSDPEKFYSRESAELALQDLLQAVQRFQNYSIVPDSTPFMVRISFGDDKYALYSKSFSGREEAMLCRDGLSRMIDAAPGESDVVEHKIVQRPNLMDVNGNSVAQSASTFEDGRSFRDHVAQHPGFFQEAVNWSRSAAYPENADMIYDESNDILINWNVFAFYSRRNIVRKPGKFGYELLDSENNFRLYSDVPRDSEVDAERSAKDLLKRIASDPDCLMFVEDNDEYHLEVRNGDLIEVRTEESKDREETLHLRESIRRIVRTHGYSIAFIPEASTWKFRFIAGHEAEQFEFKSLQEYQSTAAALADAALFFQNVNEKSLRVNNSTLLLEARVKKNRSVIAVLDVNEEGRIELARQTIENYLSVRDEIRSDLSRPEQLPEKYIINDIGDAKRQWVYRLVDKDNLLAFYKPAIEPNDARNAELKRKELYQTPPAYDFTEIVLSEECVRSDAGEKSGPKFYYCILSRQEDGTVLALFESVTKYSTAQEAFDGFLENYLTVLSKARDPENYGKGKTISLERVDDNHPEDALTIVFIPESTKEFYSWHDHLAIENLVKIARKYPIRYITREEDQFYELFKCEVDNRDKPLAECPPPQPGIRYYYFVLTDSEGNELWQGSNYYSSRQEAVDQFRFFLDLLKYPGNFVIERDFCECQSSFGERNGQQCVCHLRIWIREVLAESKKRFVSVEEAWSALERFICVAQSGDSINAYQSAEDCSHSFDIMCRSGLIHPVAYHSERERNQAMGELHNAFEEFKTRQFPALRTSDNGWQLINSRNEIIAEIAISSGRDDLNELCLADVFYDLFENLQYFNSQTGIILRGLAPQNRTDSVVIKPHDPGMDPFEWANLLHEAASRYPIVKKANGKYYLVIRLSGFGLMEGGDIRSGSGGVCNRYAAAWEGLCCFDSCTDVWSYLASVQNCLSELSHYRGVYDCECGPYHIGLICECDTGGKKRSEVGRKPESELRDTYVERQEVGQRCCNEVIARNPQRYRTPRINCMAIARARSLINAEGLHLVEHILLRPRCPEDCVKEFPKLTTCTHGDTKLTDEKLEWRSTWSEYEVDNRNEAIEFHPGGDPYSFIASVFLPAWPLRFRSVENRLLIENLLYREIPAHIMLRIFWLRPVDFCGFESLFKKWHVWIGQGRTGRCLDEDPTARLVDMLINRRFDQMDECTPCNPCNPPIRERESCFENEAEPCEGVTVFRKINELFCWANATESVIARAVSIQQSSQTSPGRERSATTDIQARRRVFNSRLTRYKSQMRTDSGSRRNTLAEETELFLNKQKPDRKDFIELAKRILKKESSAGAKVQMDRSEQHTLFEVLTFFYLDKLMFYAKPAGMAGKPLKDFFSSISARKVDKEKLFEKWEARDLVPFESGISADDVRRIVTGKQDV